MFGALMVYIHNTCKVVLLDTIAKIKPSCPGAHESWRFGFAATDDKLDVIWTKGTGLQVRRTMPSSIGADTSTGVSDPSTLSDSIICGLLRASCVSRAVNVGAALWEQRPLSLVRRSDGATVRGGLPDNTQYALRWDNTSADNYHAASSSAECPACSWQAESGTPVLLRLPEDLQCGRSAAMWQLACEVVLIHSAAFIRAGGQQLQDAPLPILSAVTLVSTRLAAHTPIAAPGCSHCTMAELVERMACWSRRVRKALRDQPTSDSQPAAATAPRPGYSVTAALGFVFPSGQSPHNYQRKQERPGPVPGLCNVFEREASPVKSVLLWRQLQQPNQTSGTGPEHQQHRADPQLEASSGATSNLYHEPHSHQTPDSQVLSGHSLSQQDSQQDSQLDSQVTPSPGASAPLHLLADVVALAQGTDEPVAHRVVHRGRVPQHLWQADGYSPLTTKKLPRTSSFSYSDAQFAQIPAVMTDFTASQPPRAMARQQAAFCGGLPGNVAPRSTKDLRYEPHGATAPQKAVPTIDCSAQSHATSGRWSAQSSLLSRQGAGQSQHEYYSSHDSRSAMYTIVPPPSPPTVAWGGCLPMALYPAPPPHGERGAGAPTGDKAPCYSTPASLARPAQTGLHWLDTQGYTPEMISLMYQYGLQTASGAHNKLQVAGGMLADPASATPYLLARASCVAPLGAGATIPVAASTRLPSFEDLSMSVAQLLGGVTGGVGRPGGAGKRKRQPYQLYARG